MLLTKKILEWECEQWNKRMSKSSLPGHHIKKKKKLNKQKLKTPKAITVRA